MSIQKVLGLYGFTVRADGSLYWGVGSLVWGHSVTVKVVGCNRYEVTLHHWAYDCEGDPEYDTTTTRTLYGAEALAWIFTDIRTRYF